jgi:hypothetical protein
MSKTFIYRPQSSGYDLAVLLPSKMCLKVTAIHYHALYICVAQLNRRCLLLNPLKHRHCVYHWRRRQHPKERSQAVLSEIICCGLSPSACLCSTDTIDKSMNERQQDEQNNVRIWQRDRRSETRHMFKIANEYVYNREAYCTA